jgi:hypothetical protein
VWGTLCGFPCYLVWFSLLPCVVFLVTLLCSFPCYLVWSTHLLFNVFKNIVLFVCGNIKSSFKYCTICVHRSKVRRGSSKRKGTHHFLLVCFIFFIACCDNSGLHNCNEPNTSNTNPNNVTLITLTTPITLATLITLTTPITLTTLTTLTTQP